MRNNENKKMRIIFCVSLAIAIILGIIIAKNNTKDDDMSLTYGEVLVAIQERNVEKISAYRDSHNFFIYLKSDEDSSSKNMYITTIPNVDEFTSFIGEEIKNGNPVDLEIKEEETGISTFFNLLTSSLTVFFLIYMLRTMTGSSIKVKPIKSDIRFRDVAGIDEEKRQVEEIVEFLRNPEKYREIGAKIPKGVLLSGEPGTGKTLLAKAIAGEAGVPFFQVNGSSFEEKFVGVGASRVRKLFDEAKRMSPSIIFIDEIDSVAQSRYGSKTNYSEQTLNQLLSEMDGFNTDDNVIVIAATNHIEVLDSAIRRPGRFDRTVFIPNPDVIAREEILKVHARNKTFGINVSLEQIAKKTVGFSGADLENILNEAAIYAVNQGRTYIMQEDIDEAIARIIAGLKKENSAITEYEKLITAIHEAGHAIVSRYERPDVRNFEISIIPRGNAGGYNFFDDANSTYFQKGAMEKKLKVLYGGRIAEEIILDDISNGASNDCEKASKLAYDMVVKYAMGDSYLTKIRGEESYNSEIESKSLIKMQEICQNAYESAKEILLAHEDIIKGLANLLMEREHLSQKEIDDFFNCHGI